MIDAGQIKKLLEWYDQHRRDLPWRKRRDAYGIWLSEIMLQQTMVAAVIPYYEKFLRQWPTVQDMARDDQANILRELAGLGYYSRARNLHAAAQKIVGDFGGVFPDNYKALLQLPGVGRYTAGAIAAIGFGEKVAAVDGNVIRVLSRVFGIATKLPLLTREIETAAHELMQNVPGTHATSRAGDTVQALMELGATVCIPKNPKCLLCPWQGICVAFAEGRQNDYPVRPAKKPKPFRSINIYVLENDKGEVLLRQRLQSWMLGGMQAFPSSALTKKETNHALHAEKIKWRVLPEKIVHSFTHFDAELIVHTGKNKNYLLQENEQWLPYDQLAQTGLPTLFAKILKLLN